LVVAIGFEFFFGFWGLGELVLLLA
jgi:hypothetical protein